jgi:hypothetical protein
MSQGDNGGERKMIEINPHLLAHTLKSVKPRRVPFRAPQELLKV